MTAASIEKITARLDGLDPESLRYKVLVALRTFRASWVNLGGLLIQVAYGGDYKEAGYDDFEVYCARELGLKKPTVQKLMISYNYMKKYEAGRLAALEDGADTEAAAPDFQTVELLDRVRREEAIPEDEAEEIHRRVFADGGTDSEKELRRELRERLKPTASTADSIHRGNPARELVAMVNAARRLRLLLATGPAVPEGLRERLEVALMELEGLA